MMTFAGAIMQHFTGTYEGTGTWYDAVAKSGTYRIRHTHAPTADGFDVSFTHDFDDGTVVEAQFRMTWISPRLFSVHVGGTLVGNGYLFDDFCQYHMKFGDRFVQVSYRAGAEEMQVFGSSSSNAEGNYTAWTERLRLTSR